MLPTIDDRQIMDLPGTTLPWQGRSPSRSGLMGSVFMSVLLHGIVLAVLIGWTQGHIPIQTRRIDVQLVSPSSRSAVRSPVAPPSMVEREPVSRNPRSLDRVENTVDRSSESRLAALRDSGSVAAPIVEQLPAVPDQSLTGESNSRRSGEADNTMGATGSMNQSSLVASIELDLMTWLNQHKRYPMAARRRGIEGAVRVRFVVNQQGHLLEKELVHSSGSRHLDHSAMELLEQASPFPGLPAELAADRLEVELPIEYSLVGRQRS